MSKMNPLSKYTKIENLFIKLSTNGVIKYDETVLSNHMGEIGVCARSARDELMLNTTDALMNGTAIASVIENCVPSILDAKKLFVPDVEQILVAIKLATKERSYQIEATCPNEECKRHGAFDRDLEYLSNTVTYLEEVPVLSLDDGSGLVLTFRPHTWEEHSSFGVRMFNAQKGTQMLEQNEELTQEEKTEYFSKIVEDITQMNFDMVVANIDKIETPDGDVVSDKEFINEWLGSQPAYVLSSIREKVLEFDFIGMNHSLDVQCSGCGHEWTIDNIVFDPSHFFVLA